MERKKREAHSKSRRGCQNCKKRHVKCDEQSPRCANCIVRKLNCIYQSHPESGGTSTSLTRRPKKAPRSDPLESSSDSSSVVESRISVVPSPASSLASSPAAFSSTPESHRLLELELMHRWTTRTYMGLVAIPEDQPHLQDYLPRAALRNSYLMNGILALSALELARASETPATYLPAAIEYSNKASADFRIQLCNITRDNLHLLYYFAMIAATFNFALPPEQMSAIDRIGIAFDMVIGATAIATTNIEWLMDSPMTLGIVIGLGRASMEILDSETSTALDHMVTVSSQMSPKLIIEEKETMKIEIGGQEQEIPCPPVNEQFMYWLAIAHLKYCFAEDARGLIQGYCMTFVPLSGTDFICAIRKQEPVALFVLMYFGVLMDRYGEDTKVWWMMTTGRDLVKEASEILLRTPIAMMESGREGIVWTRRQVGLPPLLMESYVCPEDLIL
ncbi:hypothetical protein N431DRAFT_503275 [Stipitochalara longipes BDJ]|nr:hypothetical protein N431DRAFT_503275 [Stipitochalara longipes BDJ]